MPQTVRFAPSPTGRLHIGNVRTAILNWLFARKGGGRFLLRFDDTDTERSREEFVAAIRADLSWLGLTWDAEAQQSERLARYAEVAEILKAKGRLYACYETPDELERRRRRQLARGLPPIYDRAGLALTSDERARLEAEGRRPHWRFRLANSSGDELAPLATPIIWADMIRGPQSIDIGSLSDPVLIREDGTCLYTLSSVIDDVDFSITHILRGEDHLTNTAVQIDLFRAIGAEPPVFGHHSLLVGADGQALSKRLGALSVESFRTAGLEAMAVASHAALIGTSDAIEPHASLDDLAALFDPAKISLAPARFDLAELEGLNARLVHRLSYAEVAPRLEELRIGGGEAFWMAVRGNLARVADAVPWWAVVAGPVKPVIEDAGLAATALDVLPPEPWDEATWKAWTEAVRARTGAKGRQLFHPLRLALTGRDTGPELRDLLPLIGRERVVARLSGRTA